MQRMVPQHPHAAHQGDREGLDAAHCCVSIHDHLAVGELGALSAIATERGESRLHQLPGHRVRLQQEFGRDVGRIKRIAKTAVEAADAR